MAERRMFSKTIIDSDAFLDMPVTARLLYYDLSMRADDDGFVNNPKKIMRSVGASADDLSILIMRNFIIPFETGIVVIKHWRLHNYIQKDRYKETVYKTEKALLAVDESKEYVLTGNLLDTKCIQSVSSLDTQDRLGKDRTVKDSIDKETRHKYGEYKNVLLSDEDLAKLKAEFPDWEARIERLSSYIASTGKKYKSHLATIRNWARNDKPKVDRDYGDPEDFYK